MGKFFLSAFGAMSLVVTVLAYGRLISPNTSLDNEQLQTMLEIFLACSWICPLVILPYLGRVALWGYFAALATIGFFIYSGYAPPELPGEADMYYLRVLLIYIIPLGNVANLIGLLIYRQLFTPPSQELVRSRPF
ncbi:hypothetical protein BH11PAT2_BH11PAT2_02750 [soil metagenome]